MSMDGGMASLKLDGFEEPLGISIGLPEAAAMLYASGLESRRPSTLKTWQQSLDVRLLGTLVDCQLTATLPSTVSFYCATRMKTL